MERPKRYSFTVTVFLALLASIAVSVYAQQDFREINRNYDASRIEVISGHVSDVRDIETASGTISGAGLKLAVEDGNISIFLGPHSYVDPQNFKINRGDRVAVIGVRASIDGRTIFLAGEVRKDEQVLKLRDEKGMPLWKTGEPAGKRIGRTDAIHPAS